MRNKQNVSSNEVESVNENDQIHDYERLSAEEAQVNVNETEEHISNGLENFGVEGEAAPDLFTSDNETTETEGLLSSDNDENSNEDDDDLEIPAFLRRQKN